MIHALHLPYIMIMHRLHFFVDTVCDFGTDAAFFLSPKIQSAGCCRFFLSCATLNIHHTGNLRVTGLSGYGRAGVCENRDTAGEMAAVVSRTGRNTGRTDRTACLRNCGIPGFLIEWVCGSRADPQTPDHMLCMAVSSGGSPRAVLRKGQCLMLRRNPVFRYNGTPAQACAAAGKQ